MDKDIWYLDNFDFYKILCPYKLEDHLQKNPNDVLNKNEFLFMEKDPCKEIILIDCGKVKIGHYDQEGNFVTGKRGDPTHNDSYLFMTFKRHYLLINSLSFVSLSCFLF